MADIALAASPIATPLAAWLASGEIQPETTVYRGVITPLELDARATETEALVLGAAVHDLGWLRRVKVRGEDRFRWLSGMVTNTVNDLVGNAGAWNLVLNAQGRIQGDVTVWRRGEKLELEIAVDQLDRLLTHFERFIIMDDVELVTREGETALGIAGPKAGEVLARLGLPVLAEPMTHAKAEWNGLSMRVRRNFGVVGEHYELWTSVGTVAKLWKCLITGGAVPIGAAAVEAFRVAEGIPSYGIDMMERDLPQETSQMRALHFNKGCYLGQEIVERIRSRGTVHRHLRALELDPPERTPSVPGPVDHPMGGDGDPGLGALPAAGAELRLDGAAVGNVTSAAELPLSSGTRRFAMGMVRSEAEVKNRPLHYNAGDATAGTARLLNGAPAF